MADEMDEDLNSPEWQDFAARLLKEHRETPKTSIASPSFLARMTSSATEPDGAEPTGEKD
ncbi:MAG: hypothetical protein ACT6U0_14165 [Shinella sp.]|uniref:hypothetical protein n=1 Tax=Shinella sp. TaxID=1870904 RepID=UPI00403680BD